MGFHNQSRWCVLMAWVFAMGCVVVARGQFAWGTEVREGRLRTVGGNEYLGRIRWDVDRFVVANARSGLLTRVPLEQVESLDWKREKSWVLPGEAAESVAAGGEWEWSTLGLAAVRASYQAQGGTIRIRSYGADIGGGGEDAPFLYQSVEGDFEIMGRMVAQSWTHPMAKSGLMIRASSDPVSAMIFAGVTSQRGDVVEFRGMGNPETQMLSIPSAPYARWFKLKRRGDDFWVYRSRDASRWSLLWQTNMVMPARLHWGLAGSGKSDLRMHQTTWEGVRTGARLLRSSGSGVRVELRSGSVIEAPSVELYAGVVRFGGVEKRPEVRVSQLSRISFQSLPAGSQRSLRLGIRGVLLSSGEFMEGEVELIRGDRLVMSSVLVGKRDLDVDNQVSLLVLGVTRAVGEHHELRMEDGSEWNAMEVKVEGEDWLIREPVLGWCRVPMVDVVEFRRGGGK